jgi:hypothetical protein
MRYNKHMKNFNEIIDKIRVQNQGEPINQSNIIAVAGSDDENVQEAVKEATELGLAKFI